MPKVTKLHPRNNILKVGLDAPTLRALDRFSDSIGRPKSRIVAEMLTGVAPLLVQFSDATDRIKQISQPDLFAESVRSLGDELASILGAIKHD